MGTQWGVRVGEAVLPLVIALDVGSTASRGALYDARGRPVGKRVKVPHAFTTGMGASEIDADQVVSKLASVIDGLVAQAGDLPVAGVALDTFSSSMVVVDDVGRAITSA